MYIHMTKIYFISKYFNTTLTSVLQMTIINCPMNTHTHTHTHTHTRARARARARIYNTCILSRYLLFNVAARMIASLYYLRQRNRILKRRIASRCIRFNEPSIILPSLLLPHDSDVLS